MNSPCRQSTTNLQSRPSRLRPAPLRSEIGVEGMLRVKTPGLHAAFAPFPFTTDLSSSFQARIHACQLRGAAHATMKPTGRLHKVSKAEGSTDPSFRRRLYMLRRELKGIKPSWSYCIVREPGLIRSRISARRAQIFTSHHIHLYEL